MSYVAAIPVIVMELMKITTSIMVSQGKVKLCIKKYHPLNKGDDLNE
jgi:hypothetical protein